MTRTKNCGRCYKAKSLCKCGRPTVMTPTVIAKLEEAFTWGCTDIEACLWADISVAALWDYMQKYPEFSTRRDKLKKTPTLTARRTVVASLPGDNEMSLKYLERKEKREFSLRQETEIANREGEAFVVSEITAENVDDILQKLLIDAKSLPKGNKGK